MLLKLLRQVDLALSRLLSSSFSTPLWDMDPPRLRNPDDLPWNILDSRLPRTKPFGLLMGAISALSSLEVVGTILTVGSSRKFSATN